MAKIKTSPKVLVIRFSSFGDVLQTLSVVSAIHSQWPQASIHWVTRSEFIGLIENHPHLTKAWGLNKKEGFKGLVRLSRSLSQESFDFVYDAHNNLRSHFLCFYLFYIPLFTLRFIFKDFSMPKILRRSIKRWKRFLLFKLRINTFEQPFSGQRDLLEPLQKWGIPSILPPTPQLFLSPINSHSSPSKKSYVIPKPYVALAPSAAFELKRWPLKHWISLLNIWLDLDRTTHFVLLGGPEDHFLKEIQIIDTKRIFNMAGILNHVESARLVKDSLLLITNDTGLLHVGEQLGHPTIALMGPAPFGYPSRIQTTKIMEIELSCRPCSKHGQGPCRNLQYQECLESITPEMVYEVAMKYINQITKALASNNLEGKHE